VSKAPGQAEESLMQAQMIEPEASSQETLTKPDGARGQIARAAALVLFAFIISNVIGLGQQLVMSRYFGTGQPTG
jgi:hypothetical protein